MDMTLEYALSLFGGACRCEAPARPIDETDWNKIYDICLKHMSLPLIFPAVMKLRDGGYGGIPDDLFMKWKKNAFDEAITNYTKKMAAMKVLRSMESERIPFVVLKGDSIAWRYPTPLDRISTDLDVLVPAKNEKRTLKFLKELGAEIEKKPAGGLHTRCFLPDAGRIEIHTSLMDELLTDVVFKSYNNFTYDNLQKGSCPAVDGGLIPCLAGEDEFIFMFMHFAKHFLSAGCKLRNLADVIVLMNAVNDSVNWDFIQNYLRGMKLDVLLSAVALLGTSRFGYAAENIPNFGDCPQELADEAAAGIAYSKSLDEEKSMGRTAFFTRKEYKQSGVKFYLSYMRKWMIPVLLEKLFPPINKLKTSYRFVDKNPFLAPAAYAVNFVKCAAMIFDKKKLKKFFTIKNKNTGEQKPDERIELIKKLKIL